MGRKLNKRLVEMANEELYALNPLAQFGRIAVAAEKERRRRRAAEDARDEAREFHDATESSDWAKWIPDLALAILTRLGLRGQAVLSSALAPRRHGASAATRQLTSRRGFKQHLDLSDVPRRLTRTPSGA